MIKFSIITVCYNEKENIEQCVNSVFSQTHKNIEYIIIDGGSVDGTAEYLDSISHKLFFYESKNDSGIYNAMNKALKYATGEVLYFLNASDYFYDKNVLSQVSTLYIKDDNAHIIHGNLAYSKTRDSIIIEGNEKFIFNNLNDLYRNNLAQQCFFIKRTLFCSLGEFNEAYQISADYDWIIKAYKANFNFTYTPLIFCVFDMNGISATQNKKRLAEKRSLILKHSSFGVIIKYFVQGLIQLSRNIFTKDKIK